MMKDAQARGSGAMRPLQNFQPRGQDVDRKLEIVLKADSFGSVEAITAVLSSLKASDVQVRVILSGVGDVTKQDLLMALTGSRLVIGFSVGVTPKMEYWIKDHGVEVRLYNVVYRLAEVVQGLTRNLVGGEPEDVVTGRAKVIALFKTDKGIIIGCEVMEGSLQVGRNYRIISAMGPIYSSKIETLHIEKSAVREARPGQQVGLKVPDFKGAKVGDLVETFETRASRRVAWSPKGGIVHLET